MNSTRITTPGQLRDAYQQVVDRIGTAAARSGRRREEVVLVAVTKTATPDQIRQVVELGQADLGENRVQQLTQRAAQMQEFLSRRRTFSVSPGEESAESVITGDGKAPAKAVWPHVRWHMIGHLQRNKVKQIVPLVQLIHSVDSLRLAEELHAIGSKQDGTIDILLEVNIAGEASKNGFVGAAAPHIAEQIDSMMHLRLRGMMVMAPIAQSPEEVRPIFARAHELFQEIKTSKVAGGKFNILSMGMTDDYEVAIEEGANMVRVGRAIFGEGEPEAAEG